VQCDLWGSPLVALAGRSLLRYVEDEQRDEVATAMRELRDLRRTSFACDLRCLDPEGAAMWLRAVVHPVYGADGRSSHLVSQIFDYAPIGLTPPESELIPAGLPHSSPLMVWQADRAGRPTRGNRRTVDFLGSTDDGTFAAGFFDRLHPDDEAVRVAHHERIVAGEPFEVTARSVRADGAWRWLHHRVEPLLSERGEVRAFSGVSLDVTAQQEHVDDLEEVARLFESVTEAGPLAVVRTDTTGHILYANTRWAELLNDPDARLVGRAWRHVLVREHVHELVRRSAESVETGEPFTMRVRAQDASIADHRASEGYEGRHWGELRVAPVFADDGTHEGFVATLADVTAEVAASERADRLARVLDEGTDFLFMVEATGAISYVNEAAVDELGLVIDPADEPTFLMDILDADSFTFFHEVVEPVLVETQRWRGELTIVDVDGRPVPVSALVLAQRNEQHRIETTTMVARDISDLKQAQWRMRQLATHDYLTGLPNRVLLYERLDHALARYHRFGQKVALLYLDLDRFKPINDELGHHVGDAVLVRLSDRIHTAVRETDTAARIGGDEFAVLVEGYDSAELLEAVAERLVASISDPISVEGVTVQVGVSIGIVAADSSTKDADSLLARADAAMYAAKAGGRGRFVFAPPSVTDRAGDN